VYKYFLYIDVAVILSTEQVSTSKRSPRLRAHPNVKHIRTPPIPTRYSQYNMLLPPWPYTYHNMQVTLLTAFKHAAPSHMVSVNMIMQGDT